MSRPSMLESLRIELAERQKIADAKMLSHIGGVREDLAGIKAWIAVPR